MENRICKNCSKQFQCVKTSNRNLCNKCDAEFIGRRCDTCKQSNAVVSIEVKNFKRFYCNWCFDWLDNELGLRRRKRN